MECHCPACGSPIADVKPKKAAHLCPTCGTVHLLGDLLVNRRWDGSLAMGAREIPSGSYVSPGPFPPLQSDDLQEIGPYRIEALVGEGGMGKVYLAEDRNTGERVAIKQIHKLYCTNDEFVHRFLREGKLLKNVSHKNLVRFLDLGLDEAGYFLVMGFVEGMTLKALVAQGGPLPLPVALKIVGQAARGIFEAHRNCIVHRDVKPENILVSRHGGVHVLDFGLARNILSKTTNLTVAGRVIGTPAYMSPEQCEGRTSDNRSDVYALGATLFYALAGRPPFEGTNNFAIMYKHMNDPVPDIRELNPAVTEACEHMLGRMMAKAPEERYQTLERVIDDLCLILAQMHPSLSTEGDHTVVSSRFLDLPSSDSVIDRALLAQEELRQQGRYVPPLGEMVAAEQQTGGQETERPVSFELTCPEGHRVRLSLESQLCPRCSKGLSAPGDATLETAGQYLVLHAPSHRLAYGDRRLGDRWVALAEDLARLGATQVVIDFPNLVELGQDQFMWVFDLFEIVASRGGSLGLVIPNERVRELFRSVGADHYVRLFPSYPSFLDGVSTETSPREGDVDLSAKDFLKAAIARARSQAPLSALTLYDRRVEEADTTPEPGERDFLVRVVASRLTVLGADEMECRRFRDARRLFDEALELVPDFAPALLQTGKWLLLQDQFREAAEFFTRALEASPDFAPAIEARGGSHFYMDLKERALEDFSRALELNPRSQMACYNMACVYADRGDGEAALDWLGRAVEFGWNDPAFTEQDPQLAPLREAPRFADLLARMGGEGQ